MTLASRRRSPPHTLGIYEPSPNPGGPSRYVNAVLAGIDPEEFQVRVFCEPGGPYLARLGVELTSIRDGMPEGNVRPAEKTEAAKSGLVGRWGRRWTPAALKLWSGFGRDAWRLSRVFRSAPVDLLHTQSTGCEESSVAAKLAGIPHILGTFHVDSTYDLQQVRSGLPHQALECLSNHCLDQAVAVSEATKQDWMRRTWLSADRVGAIHNGVDAEQFRRRQSSAEARRSLGLPDDGRLLLGAVGRLDPAKGFCHLLDALALLAPRFPKLDLVVAGDGPLRQSLTEQAQRLGIADRVRFLGFTRNVGVVFDAVDVFALSSLCEALPYVLLEAMAHELPVVGTSVAGVPEVIVAGETGLIVPPCDSGALAQSLTPLLESPELRLRMGLAGRQRVVDHFRQEDMVRKTINVYRTLLGRPTAAAAARPTAVSCRFTSL